MAKTEYLGNARGLTLHGGVNGMHLILPWKGQRAEVMRVMRARVGDQGRRRLEVGEGEKRETKQRSQTPSPFYRIPDKWPLPLLSNETL